MTSRQRLVVAITDTPFGEELIGRAALLAERSGAELIGVYVRPIHGRNPDPSGERLAAHRRTLIDFGGRYHEVVGDDVAAALVAFVRAEDATLLVLGPSRRGRVNGLLHGSVVNRVVRQAPAFDVHVVAASRRAGTETVRRHQSTNASRPMARRRRVAAWLIAVFGPLALTFGFVPFRDSESLAAALPALVLVVIVVALVGGTVPALFASTWGFVVGNALLARPYGTLRITEVSSVVALVALLAVGGAVAFLVGRLGRRTAEATRARAQAGALASAAATLADDDPLPELLDRLRTLLSLDAVGLVAADGTLLVSAGDRARLTGAEHVELSTGLALVTSGTVANSEDRIMLRAFGDQLAAAMHRADLARDVARAGALAEVDRFRTALLRAVSHDLRTPLASIKAAASSLLQDDVEWPSAARQEFLSAIVEEGDRLDRIVANLLDASRLEAGVLSVSPRAVLLEDLVDRVLRTMAAPPTVRRHVDPSTQMIVADPELLERVLENLLANAIRFSPEAVELESHPLPRPVGDTDREVRLRIVDHGPGVADKDRTDMFDAFQRLGDDNPGVGLGLAVAKGFVEAMGGRLTPCTTPGGGLTMEIVLRAGEDVR
jgi:two-component system sensor histidine kinase KdpD